MKKKKNIIIIIAIIVLLIVAISLAFAYWQITKEQTNPGVVATACLDISITNADDENDGGRIFLENQWPMTREDAIENLVGYTFKIENHCNQDVNYVIGLESNEISNVLEDGYLPDDSIALALDDSYLGAYADLANVDSTSELGVRSSKKIGTDVVAANSYNTYNLKLWISSNSSVDDQGKRWAGKVFINGGQGIENDSPLIATDDTCFTIDNNGMITNYDTTCGESVVVPNTINGTAVKKIADNAFKTDGLVNIKSLDLSKATDLEEIESFAFSNILPEDTDEEVIKARPVGLSNLVIGEKDHDLLIGACAFSHVDLDTLIVYANMKDSMSGYDGTQFSSITGHDVSQCMLSTFAYGNINNLVIKPTANSKIFNYARSISAGSLGNVNFSEFLFTKYNNLIISNGIEELGDQVISGSSENQNVTFSLPNSLKKIGISNFETEFVMPTNLVLPSSLEYIGNRNFAGKNVDTVVMPDTLTYVGERVLDEFNGSSVRVSKNLEVINHGFLKNYVGSSDEIIELSSNLQEIDSTAFSKFKGTIKLNADENTINRVFGDVGLLHMDCYWSHVCNIIP